MGRWWRRQRWEGLLSSCRFPSSYRFFALHYVRRRKYDHENNIPPLVACSRVLVVCTERGRRGVKQPIRWFVFFSDLQKEKSLFFLTRKCFLALTVGRTFTWRFSQDRITSNTFLAHTTISNHNALFASYIVRARGRFARPLRGGKERF